MGLVDRGRLPRPLTSLFNLGRSYSLWVYQWGLACCAIEMGAAFGSPRYDVMRLGVIPLPASPRQADLVVISGTVTDKMAPVIRRLYEQMPEPKVVVAIGICATSGGVFKECYNIMGGTDTVIPVDVYVPGCAARPEAIIDGVVKGLGVLAEKRAAMDKTVAPKTENDTQVRSPPAPPPAPILPPAPPPPATTAAETNLVPGCVVNVVEAVAIV